MPAMTQAQKNAISKLARGETLTDAQWARVAQIRGPAMAPAARYRREGALAGRYVLTRLGQRLVEQAKAESGA